MKKIILYIIMFLSIVSFASADLKDAEIYVSFDNYTVSGTLVDDLSDNDLNGTKTGVGTPAQAGLGVVEDSNYFNAASDINWGDNVDLDTYNFTISCWVRPEDYANFYMIAGKHVTGFGDANGWAIQQMQTTGNIAFFRGNGANVEQTNVAPALNVWTNIMILYDQTGSNISILLNGTEPAYAQNLYADFSSLANTNDLTIGSIDSAVRFYKGYEDECSIWYRKLNSSEIAEVYNNGSGFNPYTAPFQGFDNSSYFFVSGTTAEDQIAFISNSTKNRTRGNTDDVTPTISVETYFTSAKVITDTNTNISDVIDNHNFSWCVPNLGGNKSFSSTCTVGWDSLNFGNRTLYILIGDNSTGTWTEMLSSSALDILVTPLINITPVDQFVNKTNHHSSDFLSNRLYSFNITNDCDNINLSFDGNFTSFGSCNLDPTGEGFENYQEPVSGISNPTLYLNWDTDCFLVGCSAPFLSYYLNYTSGSYQKINTLEIQNTITSTEKSFNLPNDAYSGGDVVLRHNPRLVVGEEYSIAESKIFWNSTYYSTKFEFILNFTTTMNPDCFFFENSEILNTSLNLSEDSYIFYDLFQKETTQKQATYNLICNNTETTKDSPITVRIDNKNPILNLYYLDGIQGTIYLGDNLILYNTNPINNHTFRINSEDMFLFTLNITSSWSADQFIYINTSFKNFDLNYAISPDSVTEDSVNVFLVEICDGWNQTGDGQDSLNCVSNNFTWYKPKILYGPVSSPVLEGNPFTYNFTIIYNNTYALNTSAVINLPTLSFGASLINSQIFGQQTNETYEATVTYPLTNTSSFIFFNWNISLNSLILPVQVSNKTFNVSLLTVEVDECNNTMIYSILNMSSFDEFTGLPLNISNGYSLLFDDGINPITLSGSFNSTQSMNFCTNVNSSLFTYNWDVSGSMQLSAPGYLTRLYNLDPLSPLSVSNDPTTFLNLYLIDLANSSTVNFEWKSTNFNPLDGTQLIYKCLPNGTRQLISSLIVLGGEAVANLNLLFTSYSYEFIYEGQTFTNGPFFPCHIESQTIKSYFVDIDQTDILPVIGLFLVDCRVTKEDTNLVKVEWDSNSEDASDIQGCAVLTTTTIFGNNETFRNCTNASYGSITTRVPLLTNQQQQVSGEITQGNKLGICQDIITFNLNTLAKDVFNFSALYGVILLILGLSLIYAGNDELTLFGGGAAVVISYAIGLLTLPWVVVSAVVMFLGIIAIIGRYSRKNG